MYISSDGTDSFCRRRPLAGKQKVMDVRPSQLQTVEPSDSHKSPGQHSKYVLVSKTLLTHELVTFLRPKGVDHKSPHTKKFQADPQVKNARHNMVRKANEVG